MTTKTSELRVREGDAFMLPVELEGAGATITATTTGEVRFTHDDDSNPVAASFSPIALSLTPGSDVVRFDVTTAAAPTLNGLDIRYRVVFELTDGAVVESWPLGGERYRCDLVVEAS